MIMDRTRDLIRSATKSNVSIYAIDPRGLTDMGDIAIELNSAPAGGVTDDAGQTTGALTEQQVQSLGLRGLQNELRLQHNSLRTLAEETGGFAVINTQQLRRHLRPHRPGQQLVLRAGVLPAESEARREVPQHPGPRQSSGS